MWINSKESNICETGVSEGEKTRQKKMFDEIIAKNFSGLVKKNT